MLENQEFRLGYEFLPARRKPRIILPLDGTEQSKCAFPLAILVSQILNATIHVVHVTDELLPLAELAQHLKLTKDETRGLVLDQIKGRPAEAIAKHAHDKKAVLIVMSLRGHETPPDIALGPVVRQVIQEAPCPVMLVRPEIASSVAEMSSIRRILLPLDGAPSTAAVIGPVHELAHRSHAELDFLYVLEAGAEIPQEPGTFAYPRYVDQPQHEWPAWAQEFIERFCICPPGAYHPADECRIFLKTGQPVEAILLFAKRHNTDLVVLEWRGQLDPNHAQIVKGVLEDSPAPVLLLRVQAS